MFKNYFRIAWRNIKRHKGYSFINIVGLAIGMAVCILILLYVQYELSYDNFNEHKDRIFRIQRQWLNADGSLRGEFSSLAPSFIPLLEKEFPEMEHVVRILPGGTTVVNVGEKRFIEEQFFLAEDSGLFRKTPLYKMEHLLIPIYRPWIHQRGLIQKLSQSGHNILSMAHAIQPASEFS